MGRRRTLVACVALLGLLSVAPGTIQAQTPEAGGQIVFGLPWQPVILNPVVESDGVSYLVNLWIYDSLIRIDDVFDRDKASCRQSGGLDTANVLRDDQDRLR